jgi:hypothetical protein
MRIIREKTFSAKKVLEDVVSKLERDHYRDFEVSRSIPKDCISLTTDLNDLVIYLPLDLEYSQFGIDSFIRSMVPYARTTTVLDRNIYVMKLHGRLSVTQLVKLVKYIIEDSEFCVLIDKSN